jgi:acyl-CoA thioester hydrolase
MAWLITHRLMVRFRDCDPLGHVNNAVYLTYLEQARFTLWREQFNFMAKAASAPGKRGVGFILARAEVDFTAQARYGDVLEVRLGLESVRRSSFTYVYEIVNVATEQVVLKARTVQVRFDYDLQEPVPVDDALRVKLGEPVPGPVEGPPRNP